MTNNVTASSAEASAKTIANKAAEKSIAKADTAAENIVKGLALPEPNELPLTLDSFCQGIANTFEQTAQDYQTEAAVLCNNGTPTAALQQLFNNPYQGQGNAADFITTITPAQNPPGEQIQIFLHYAMKVPKNAVKVLLGEEQHVKTPYAEGILSISAEFDAPPENNGDADTAFTVMQNTIVNRQDDPVVQFNDLSEHHLKMYRMFPNNFDFFLASRTLVAPSEQFSKSVVLRGIMADPQDPEGSTYVFTVLNFIMNSRGDPDSNIGEGMRDTFVEFIESDLVTLYNEQVGAEQQ
jgi:hypothetical protein